MVVSTQGNIIAGVENAGIYWSTDNGTTWSERAQGLTATKIHALLSTPVGKVFAGTDEGIFYLDTTAGANWVPYGSGITAKNVLSLCRDADGRIYAGTDASGVFRSVETFNIIAPADVKQVNSTALATAIGTNYPNPVTTTTTIPFTLGKSEFLRLEVLDALGRSIETLADGMYAAGSYEATFNVADRSAGMYYVRLHTAGSSITKVIVVEK